MIDLRRPFAFLDRDGTLVVDSGYPHRPADYELIPRAVEGARRLSDAGWRLAIVTNQSGIGRSLFTEDDFQRFQNRLLSDLARAGVPIAATLMCPHTPDAGCDCRKPAPGLLVRAQRELQALLQESIVIGDKASDFEAGRNAGCLGGVRIGENEKARDLLAAADLVASGQFSRF
jgi:D-glycero-D-manno-heptose 1,7-bisphosphate phosphatase